MKFNPAKALLLCAIAAIPAASAPVLAQTGAAGALRAGAARIDITPRVADLEPPFKTIHDPLFVRAVVLDDGVTRAAIVVGDLPTIAPKEFEDIKRGVAEAAHAPIQNVLLAVTHSHGSVRIDHTVKGIALPGSPKVADMTEPRILDAVKQAVANLRPAKVGYATGSTPVVGRRGPGGPGAPDDPVDQSIGVMKVEALDGQPIAFVFSSGLEPVVNISSDTEVSADVAGVAERYIEQRFGDKPVAIYTVGSTQPAAYGGRGGPLPPANTHSLMDAMGVIMGEDVLNASLRARPTAEVKISGAQRVLQCPGKSTYPLNLPNRCSDAPGSKLPACVFKDTDTSPVPLQIGMLSIGDLKIISADADVTLPVWQRVKAVAPPNTVLVSLLYGPMHYVVADRVYPTNSYQATATMAKSGCAADGFVNTTLDLIKASR